MTFKDRTDAGKQLAKALSNWSGKDDALVLALPRGGVPVAYEIAISLHLPLDLWLVRKLGVPGQEEVAMGAIAMSGITVFNEDIIQNLSINPEDIKSIMEKEQQELNRRNNAYRHGRPAPDVYGKHVILVDDGLATGATMKAAVKALREAKVAEITVAVPVSSHEACYELEKLADHVVCLKIPAFFYGVGSAYEHFPQNTDREVQKLLSSMAKKP